jgi:hypothetical protein
MKLGVLLVYETNGKALPLARVRNPATIIRACRDAVREKRLQTAELDNIDAGLGSLSRGQCDLMERTLSQLVPGL